MSFEAMQANTPELRNEAFRLRYQVFCVENEVFDATACPGGLETDVYDERSLHALLLHKPTRMVVGTMRLILPRLGELSGKVPFFQACPEAAGLLPAGRTAEYSRLAVSKALRRRIGGALSDGPGLGLALEAPGYEGRNALPEIMLGLIGIALRMGLGHGIDYICAGMEPALLRLVNRMGVHFQPIGPLVYYHGWRQPCYAEVGKLFADLERERRHFWEIITDYGRFWPAVCTNSPQNAIAAQSSLH
jgi:N-acyl amino acid synthase of PEP-CTERM/exosortase system